MCVPPLKVKQLKGRLRMWIRCCGPHFPYVLNGKVIRGTVSTHSLRGAADRVTGVPLSFIARFQGLLLRGRFALADMTLAVIRLSV